MEKISFNVAGLTKEQIAEIQSTLDNRLNKMREENDRALRYLKEADSKQAREEFMKNAKPTVTRVETWDAAVRWAAAHRDILNKYVM